MKHFTSTATKDGRWWVIQCDQEPGALSQVARLDQAAADQREAISMVTGTPEDEIDVVVTPALPQKLRVFISHTRSERAEAERLAAKAAADIRQAARELAEMEFSMRDIGAILGVSHQRAAQLLDPKDQAVRTKPTPVRQG